MDVIKRVNVRGGVTGDSLHPAQKQAVDDLKNDFVNVVLKEQDVFREEKAWETLLSLLPLGHGAFSSIFSLFLVNA